MMPALLIFLITLAVLLIGAVVFVWGVRARASGPHVARAGDGGQQPPGVVAFGAGKDEQPPRAADGGRGLAGPPAETIS